MRKLILLAGLLLLLVLASVMTVAGQETTAYVRVAHFAAHAREVDVYMNGDLRSFGQNREYGSVTGWTIVPAGDFELAVVPDGRSMRAALIPPTIFSLAAGSRTTILVVGDTYDQAVTVQAITEDYADLSEYYARVTFVHALPGAGAVDFLDDGELLVGRLAYPGTLTLAGGGTNDGATTIDVVSGSYNLTVVPNGQAGALVEVGSTEFAGGTFYLVVVGSDADDNPAVTVVAASAE